MDVGRGGDALVGFVLVDVAGDARLDCAVTAFYVCFALKRVTHLFENII